MSFTQNIVTKRFVRILLFLHGQNMFRNLTEFTQKVNYSRQSLNEIVKGRRDVPIVLIRELHVQYGIDTNILFSEESDDDNQKINQYLKLFIKHKKLNTASIDNLNEPLQVYESSQSQYLKERLNDKEQLILSLRKQVQNLEKIIEMKEE